MKHPFQSRCLLLCLALVAALSGLSYRLVQVQVTNRAELSARSSRTFVSQEVLPAMRGMIVDRREEPLAKSIPVTSVYVDKNHLEDPNVVSYGLAHAAALETEGWHELDARDRSRRIAALRGEILGSEPAEIIVERHLALAVAMLARPLGLQREELRERITGSSGRYVRIARDLPEDLADRLREVVSEHMIQGIAYENSLKRWYTSPDIATHLTGFTGEVEETDERGRRRTRVVGRFGVEATMEEFLRGHDGLRVHRRDSRGLVIPGDLESLRPPRAGLNVQLTIDMGIQAIVEEELDAGLREFHAERGAVVLMDPRTGEVLAMASRPHFHLNRLDNLDVASSNFAIQAIYEPGSTIKVVAAAGALNEGLVNPQTSVFCHHGLFLEGAVRMTDRFPAGYLTFEGVLQKSNNIGSYKLGRQLGAGRFYDYAERFGFGRRTGIALSGEARGTARNTGNAVDFSRATIGYATNVTPLQMACAYSVIAGDGRLPEPRIVRALVANDGTVVERFEPVIRNEVLSARSAAQMRSALEKVVATGGTATQAAVPGYRVAGKTGTAWKFNPRGGYFRDRFVVSFVGMMPAQDPAFVCVVVIDDPRPPAMRIYGGTIAAPIFSRIAGRVAARMNLQPTEPVPPQLVRSGQSP